tara:strand:+ start:345 stop:785 length:441 start_codon:yes stop_codon:yes gene_type:complete
MSRKAKNPLVKKIVKIFEKFDAQDLKFETISDHLGEPSSAVAGVLSSYPAIFTKAGHTRVMNHETSNSNKQTIWRLIPEEEVDEDRIMDLYGLSLDDIQVNDGQTIRYKWISAKRLPSGKFARRDIHYMLHHMKKDEAIAKLPQLS